MSTHRGKEDHRAGAEIVRGAEACYRRVARLFAELGLPRGSFPIHDLEECGMVKETGFVWMRAQGPYEYFFESVKTRASYAAEVTAYVEKHRMRRITGIRTKHVMVWVPVLEMAVGGPEMDKICFKTAMGLGVSYPFSAFDGEEEKHRQYVEKKAWLIT